MTHDIASAALEAAGLHGDSSALLHREFERHVQKYARSPAGWHGADDIETLVGLAGTFQWLEGGESRLMSLTFDAGKEGQQGRYVLVGAGRREAGVFSCVPNNPAIGWAFISLTPEGGAPRPVIVSGMLTDAEWQVFAALLNEVGRSGPIEPGFAAIRQFD